MNETPVLPREDGKAAIRFHVWWLKPVSDQVPPRDRGGHAEIDLLFDRPDATVPVAVRKRLSTGGDPVRFEREIEITRELYLGTLFLHAALPADERAMVLRYLAGGSLRQRLRRGALPGSAESLLRRIGQSVDHYLARGILHRDLKPENIMFLSAAPDHDEVHTIDFGIAVRLHEIGNETRNPAQVGTTKYMAPERRSGAAASIATELCEFAIVAAEVAEACADHALAAAFRALAPDAQHGYQDAQTLLQAAIQRACSDLDGQWRAEFRNALDALWRVPDAPLQPWIQKERDWFAPLEDALQKALHGAAPGPLLAQRVSHDLCAPLCKAVATGRLAWVGLGRLKARDALLRCMNAAVCLCVHPARRAMLAEFKQQLKDLQTPCEPLELPLRTRESAAIAAFGIGSGAAITESLMDLAGLEGGEDPRARYEFCDLVAKSLFPPQDPLQTGRFISNDDQYRRWRGRLMDDKARGQARTLVLFADQVRELGPQRMSWLEEFGVVVITLSGGHEDFWLLDEYTLVALVERFRQQLEQL